MITIDGSLGEGGGQVLRSALTLSLVTGTPIHVHRVRAGRDRPGLRPQHLKAVEAAAAVSGARVRGAKVGSQEVVFEPGPVRPGEFGADIGTAGSTSLVLQTIVLPLCLASGPSTVALTGGTHVPWSPCFHYLDLHWMAFMRRMGIQAELEMERAGFYPQGQGRVAARLHPSQSLKPLRAVERGELVSIRGLSGLSNLDPRIAERQKRQAMRRLQASGHAAVIETLIMPAHSRGTFLLLLAEFEASQLCTFALGARGKPAEQVADEAVDALYAAFDSGAAVDEHLADQLLVPLAFAGGASEIRTARVTQHLLTNAQVIDAFLPGAVEISGAERSPGSVRIVPSSGMR